MSLQDDWQDKLGETEEKERRNKNKNKKVGAALWAVDGERPSSESFKKAKSGKCELRDTIQKTSDGTR